jgi:diguanylate cyclase (GGDEF)-like protein
MPQRLLVVEDSKPIAQVVKQIGESLHFQVTVATNLSEVKELISQGERYFVATVDYSLPDALNGQAINFLLDHQTPCIVVTGNMASGIREQMLELPIIDYITKENSQAFMYLKSLLKYQVENQKIGVLVVDDSRSARALVSSMLKRRNFNVYSAENGQQALSLMAEHSDIRLVITDHEMPIMDGIQLVHKLRKNYDRDALGIIGISGSSSGIHSARFIKNGADDFLTKPFCPEEFYCRITQNIERLLQLDKIKKLANYDFLTELPNRRFFFEEADHFLTKNKHLTVALAIWDIDFFKKINDVYGHDGGDYVLKTLARMTRKLFEDALVARFGGEEFVMLLSGGSYLDIQIRLENFREAVAKFPLEYDGKGFNFSLSIGTVKVVDKPIEVLIQQADEALYQAKETGRNRLISYDGS